MVDGESGAGRWMERKEARTSEALVGRLTCLKLLGAERLRLRGF